MTLMKNFSFNFIRSSGPLLVVILSIILWALPVAAEVQLTDQMVSNAVEEELALDSAVNLNNIFVQTDKGIVSLEGDTDNLLTKKRAARIASTVKGVAGVINRIEVIPPYNRSDAEIFADVAQALMSNPATEYFQISPVVSNNTVTLNGSAESWQERRSAELVAAGVRGVKEVVNNIQLVFLEEDLRPDSEIRADVSQRLRWDVLVDHALIDIEVKNRKVMLSGVVGSFAEKQRAIVQSYVVGVESVDGSELKVRYWARHPRLREKKYDNLKEADIARAVKKALMMNHMVDESKVKVEIKGRKAVLRGELKSLVAKWGAGDDARAVVGINSVENKIRVRPGIRVVDKELAQRVRMALARNPYTEVIDIKVRVNAGTAKLYGAVDSYFEKAEAERVAATIAGVSQVDNFLKVQNSYSPYSYSPYIDHTYLYGRYRIPYAPVRPYKSDQEIAEDIKDELYWSPFVDSDQVKVEVENGQATLTGQVDTKSESEAAKENAYDGGATWVINDLKIDQQ
jgi:osmotically-inducible protein OsmY